MVLYPIFAVSVLAFYIGFSKLLLISRIILSRQQFVSRFINKDKNIQGGRKGRLHPFYTVLTEKFVTAQSFKARKTAYNQFLMSITPKLTRQLSTMVACAVITPLLGLLGTITGMNEMFSIIGIFGFGSPTIMAHGISVALQATLTGLGVAVTVIFFHNYLLNKKNKLIDSMRLDYKSLFGVEKEESSDSEEKGDFMHADYRLIPEENERPDINLAPFVDTIMILLIFFVVTANLYVETGVDVTKPKAAAAKPVDNKAVLIGVTREGTVHVYGRQVNMERLRLLLEQEAAKQPDLSVVIISDRDASVGKAVEIMDQCNLAGVYKVSIAAGKE